eukprot:354346-Chlamydomonas_euryale.AAC.14
MPFLRQKVHLQLATKAKLACMHAAVSRTHWPHSCTYYQPDFLGGCDRVELIGGREYPERLLGELQS